MAWIFILRPQKRFMAGIFKKQQKIHDKKGPKRISASKKLFQNPSKIHLISHYFRTFSQLLLKPWIKKIAIFHRKNSDFLDCDPGKPFQNPQKPMQNRWKFQLPPQKKKIHAWILRFMKDSWLPGSPTPSLEPSIPAF